MSKSKFHFVSTLAIITATLVLSSTTVKSFDKKTATVKDLIIAEPEPEPDPESKIIENPPKKEEVISKAEAAIILCHALKVKELLNEKVDERGAYLMASRDQDNPKASPTTYQGLLNKKAQNDLFDPNKKGIVHQERVTFDISNMDVDNQDYSDRGVSCSATITFNPNVLFDNKTQNSVVDYLTSNNVSSSNTADITFVVTVNYDSLIVQDIEIKKG